MIKTPSRSGDTYSLVNAADHGIQHANPSYPHQTQEEVEGVSVQAETHWLGEQDGAHQLPLGGEKTWRGRNTGFCAP